jgi:hypothetical protein
VHVVVQRVALQAGAVADVHPGRVLVAEPVRTVGGTPGRPVMLSQRDRTAWASAPSPASRVACSDTPSPWPRSRGNWLGSLCNRSTSQPVADLLRRPPCAHSGRVETTSHEAARLSDQSISRRGIYQ